MTWRASRANIDQENPYVHWWWDFEDPQRQELFVPRTPPAIRVLNRHHQETPTANEDPRMPIYKSTAPVPGHADSMYENVDPAHPDQIKQAMPDDLPPNTVITAIVDTGIALGHRCTRHLNGKTRIIAAWQQTAKFGDQRYLPFGQELYQHQINFALERNSQDGTMTGPLDEDAFNRDLHVVEPQFLLGHRDLDYHGAHGTHVMDLAAGMDPHITSAQTTKANPLIVVNLPPQSLHGSAGNFLAFWAIHAVARILDVVDGLSAANPDTEPPGGFPVVINFSYGMQAGSKDGRSQWEKALAKLLNDRAAEGKAPVRLVMPVGNDNLERGIARSLLGGQGSWTSPGGKTYPLATELSVPWRIPPGDHTSNFVEIWANALVSKENPDAEPPNPTHFRLFVTPPGAQEAEVPQLRRGGFANKANFARVYCRDDGSEQIGFVVCIAPTLRLSPDLALAPAGEWKLRIEYHCAAVNVAFNVQSDQAGVRHSRNGEQSYFDHENFVTYFESGRPRDSHDYETGDHTDDWCTYGPVQMKGTQNALATTEHVVVLGGFRRNDGRPTLYSSTTDGNSKRNYAGPEILDACYPTEDTPSLFGVLASGSRDGSVSRFRGTSMAAAQATRHIAETMQADPANRDTIGTKNWVRDQAKAFLTSPDRPIHYITLRKLKGGVGQIPTPSSIRNSGIHRP